MMTTIIDRAFHGLKVSGKGGVRAENVEFVRCTFESCTGHAYNDQPDRPIFRNIILRQCSAIAGSLGGAILEDVLIDGLDTSDLLLMYDVACKHVKIRGRIKRAMFSVTMRGERGEEYRRLNAEYYRTVDWALDIREADPSTLDIIPIPGRLVLRNPENSVRLLRSKLLDEKWKRPGVEGTLCAVGIDYILSFRTDDSVLVAWPRQKKYYKDDLEAFKILKAEGIAEPD